MNLCQGPVRRTELFAVELGLEYRGARLDEIGFSLCEDKSTRALPIEGCYGARNREAVVEACLATKERLIRMPVG